MAKKSKSKVKSPKGRAGQKKKLQRGAPWEIDHLLQGSRRGGALATDDDDDDDDGDRGFRGFKGFAQPRAREDRPRDPSFRLRHQTISFVSAGTSTPIESDPKSTDASFLITRDVVQTNRKSIDTGDELIEVEEVSADALRTNIVIEAEVELSNNALARMNLDGAVDEVPSQLQNDSSMRNSNGDEANHHMDTPLFVIDTTGDTSLAGSSHTGGRSRKIRTPSLVQSDSSEEVVVFHGRKKPTVIDDPVRGDSSRESQPSLAQVKQSSSHSGEHLSDTQNPPITPNSETPLPQAPPRDLLTALESIIPPPQQSSTLPSWPSSEDTRFKASGWGSQESRVDRAVNPDVLWAPAPSGSWWRRKKSPPSFPDEAPAETTIAQLQDDWKKALREKKQGKKTSQESDLMKLKPPKPQRRGKRGGRKDKRGQPVTVDSDDISDDADKAAVEDYVANVMAQSEEGGSTGESISAFANLLSAHNAALGGPSMVIDGREISENELLDDHMNVDEDKIDDHVNDELVDEEWTDTSSDEVNDELNLSNLDSTDLEDALEYTEQEQWEDELAIRRHKVETMSDEQIAYLLAKQQELGIYDDELILEGGEIFFEGTDTDEAGDLKSARAAIAKLEGAGRGRQSSAKRPKARGGRNGPTFADATMLADMVDQYGENGFDVMDFDRPSLRPTKKGRKGQLPAELEGLSDDELRDTMAEAWANDRSKKAKKKAEREELRHQGLLGSKNGKPDLVERYQNGITMAQVHQELRDFLTDGSTTRAFPPMDKHDRKDLHQIANTLKLKSKSVGAGKMRRPVLYKTTSTRFSTALLDNVISRSERGWLGGSRKGLKKAIAHSGGGGSGGGFSKAAVSLRNGEIVGAGAAEIGKENFGHRMMEKMGWSKGQALGKDGEGRLAPVEQVMRAGRAGLG